MSRKEALSSFIQQIHGRPVVVKLNSGVDYRGKIYSNLDLKCTSFNLILVILQYLYFYYLPICCLFMKV